MILNPNKTKALVVSRFRTVHPSHDDLVMAGVSNHASPNLDMLGVKFDSKLTFEDHVRGIVSRVSQRIGILKLVKCIFVDTSVLLTMEQHVLATILGYCSPVLPSASRALGVFSGQALPLIKVCCRCVIGVMLLDCVLYKVNSNSNHCLFG